MKTIIYGHATADHLVDAELFSGITPSAYITNGSTTPPVSNLETTVIPPCPMIPGEAGLKQNHWRMVLQADALILAEHNEHLLDVAQRYDLLIYEAGVL